MYVLPEIDQCVRRMISYFKGTQVQVAGSQRYKTNEDAKGVTPEVRTADRGYARPAAVHSENTVITLSSIRDGEPKYLP